MEAKKTNNLKRVNDILFAQLDRLADVDMTDRERLMTEIERARAVKGLADTVISNGRLALNAAQASTAVGEAVRIPRMIDGR